MMDVAGPHVPQIPMRNRYCLAFWASGLAYLYHLHITDIILNMELIETLKTSVM